PSSFLCPSGSVAPTPVPPTPTVTPLTSSAPRCAAASMPRASPETIVRPFWARSRERLSAALTPYVEHRREPTTARQGLAQALFKSPRTYSAIGGAWGFRRGGGRVCPYGVV